MGTSSSYNGPNKAPLLPPDFEYEDPSKEEGEENEKDNGENETEDSSDATNDTENSTSKENSSESEVSWSAAKGSMTRFANGNASSPGRALSNYVKAYGGSKGAGGSAKGGVRATISLGNYIQQVNSTSLKETLDSFDFDYNDKSAKEIVSFLSDKLSPNPNTKEDAVARKAMLETMIEYYSLIEQDSGIESLERVGEDSLNILIDKYIINYIYERIINDLGKRFESSAEDSEQVISKENEVKEYIKAKVETSSSLKKIKTFDFKGSDINKKIAGIYIQCYDVLKNI